MDNPVLKCCVCLNSHDTFLKTSELSVLGVSRLTKLQNVVPEVEWSPDYNICASCTVSLDVAYDFRNLCLQLDCDRKGALIPKVEAPLVYKCYHCNADFDNKHTLAVHIQGYHIDPIIESNPSGLEEKKIKHECGHCNKSFASQKRLKSHSKCCSEATKPVRMVKRRGFTCQACDLVFHFAKNVIDHCVEAHSMDRKTVKPYTCDECPMRFSSSTNLIQHKKYHKGSRSHICSFCGKSYITKSDLTVHEYTHFNRRNYKCELCDKAFNTNKNLRSHNLVVHTDSSLWKFNCEVCHKRFPLKSGYEQHSRRHTGDKPFACHICEKPFVSRSELQKHMGYHSKVKPFKCTHCDKSYKERRFYEIHLTKTHGIGDAKVPLREKRFACHVCPSTFFDRQKLERHLRTHSGVKPYECPNCDKKFTDKYYLKQHSKNVHNVDMSDMTQVTGENFEMIN